MWNTNIGLARGGLLPTRGGLGVLLALIGAAALAACSVGVSGDKVSSGNGGSIDSGTGGGTTFEPNPGAGSPDAPEAEVEESFRVPVVSGNFLWTANPETNRVARIHASNLEIEIFDGGHGPTFLAALPEGPTFGGALILNELSHDASIFLRDEDGGIIVRDRIPVQEGASAWEVSRGGKYAIAWSKFGESSLSGIDGHQDLTIFDFTGDDIATLTLSVGFRPSEVFINEAETFAYVVSDPGISVISLTGDIEVTREIFLPENNLVGARDIEFSPDGKLAMSRAQGSADILLVNTEDASTKTVTLSGPVTDLDMSADGSIAVAVVRGGQTQNQGLGGAGGAGSTDQSIISLMDPKTIFASPQVSKNIATDEIVGSVVIAADGSSAVLYTNASDSNFLTVLDPQTDALRLVDLKAPVRAAFLSEDGTFGVALMAPPPGSSKSGAFALVPVAKELPPRIEGTDNIPDFVTLATEEQRALITTKQTATKGAQTFFARMNTLRVDKVDLPSKPLASGIVPAANQGFVAQEHPEGRVTFIDLETGAEKTVTGFELAAKVVEE